ncbi:MAG: hypothetical protein HUU35_12605 [Armatimonadetes bacterium]|nr:hypothetical protein [Armatimonadota bacterium]
MVAWLTLSLMLALVDLAPPPYAAPGPCEVSELRGAWRDEARQREVPYKIYLPAGEQPAPVIIFSHGLGGSRENYQFQGQHWASHGLVAVHLQHPGSDESVWRDVPVAQRRAALNKAVADPQQAWHRPRDVRLAVDQLTLMNRAEGPLRGRLDLEQLGMAGHSFGAWTTQAVIGMANPRLRVDLGFHDPRFRAAVIESPNHSDRSGDPAAVYSPIAVPALHLTGRHDDSPIGDNLTRPEQRRVPFDHITRADQYLLVLAEGDHMIFSGRSASDRNEARDARYQTLILASTTAFWKACLTADTAAREFLASGLPALLGQDGTWEFKAGKP